MTRAQRVLGIAAVFGLVAALAYWLYLWMVEGSAPSLSDLWYSVSGGFTAVTGIGKISQADIRTLASAAGFEGSDLDTAVAIAMAESSGNPNANGDTALTAGGSVGLWQINLKYHPEWTAAELRDPQTNANAAYKAYREAGNSFQPWSTFKSGAYEAYLPVAVPDTTASAATDATATDATVSDNTSPDSFGGSSNG